MLIKLVSGGLDTDIRNLKAEVGAKFFRYLFDGAYDKGEVTAIDDDEVVVDFLDTIRGFPRETITLVYGGAHGEHLMTHGEGRLIKDFRRDKMADSQCETSLEDLLDFDKWMV